MTSSGTSRVKVTSAGTGSRHSRRSAAKPTRGRSRRRPAKAQQAGPVPEKRITKRDQLAALLVRDEGATIDQMREVTGWLPHTVRAAVTGLKKLGYAIDSDKAGGLRTYRAMAPQ